ncbi:MAG: hypothetical protein LLF86_09330 [Nitrospiraceae bacterium]|nr:hypothetical protein [Nitrospiraceae bacterium]
MSEAFPKNDKPAAVENKLKKMDFSKEPVAYMTEIYKSYHDWRVDDGIDGAKKALAVVNGMYEKNINATINDPKLKRNRAFEIKSTLHTMLGMLYYRKSLMTFSGKSITPLLDGVDKKKGLSDKDLERISEKLKNDKSSSDAKKYFNSAREEFQTAVKADAANPVPHFQLGTILGPGASMGQTAEAEKEFFTAAKLSIGENDPKSAARAQDALKNLNPKSEYLKQLAKIMKESKNAK